MNPQKTYDTLIKDITLSGLIDSIKIIGRPILVPSIDFRVDTLRVNQYRISYEKLQDRITAIDISKSINELEELFVINDYGQEVPIMAFTESYLKSEYYKPEIFIPTPESYNYQGRRAVKIELYCKKKNKKELIDFVKNIIQNYSHNFIYDYWKYEIVK